MVRHRAWSSVSWAPFHAGWSPEDCPGSRVLWHLLLGRSSSAGLHLPNSLSFYENSGLPLGTDLQKLDVALFYEGDFCGRDRLAQHLVFQVLTEQVILSGHATTQRSRVSSGFGFLSMVFMSSF